MKLLNLILLLMLNVSIIVSCGGGNGGKDNEIQNEEDTSGHKFITFDSELTSEERAAAQVTLQILTTFNIDGSQVRGFTEMFGGNNSADVATYIDERVNYFISENTPYRSRIVPAAFTTNNLFEIFASNPSVFIWYEANFNAAQDLKYVINEEEIDISSSRIGVIQIGEGLVQADPAVKAATIVHEARHSDCKDGALASDIERFNTGGTTISHIECGHFHGRCPPGHIFAGMVACDLFPWGAYIADALYSDAIVRTCDSCSEEQKQAASINRADALSRPAYDVDELLDGKLGPADMRSSNVVR